MTHEKKLSLYRATIAGDFGLAKKLLSEGADPNHGNPLEHAARDGRSKMVSLLLEHGADPNAKNSGLGFAPIHCAVAKGHRDVVSILLDAGASPNAADNRGKTPLHVAAEQGYADICEMLIARGADSAALDFGGRSPLDLAKAPKSPWGLSEPANPAVAVLLAHQERAALAEASRPPPKSRRSGRSL